MLLLLLEAAGGHQAAGGRHRQPIGRQRRHTGRAAAEAAAFDPGGPSWRPGGVDRLRGRRSRDDGLWALRAGPWLGACWAWGRRVASARMVAMSGLWGSAGWWPAGWWLHAGLGVGRCWGLGEAGFGARGQHAAGRQPGSRLAGRKAGRQQVRAGHDSRAAGQPGGRQAGRQQADRQPGSKHPSKVAGRRATRWGLAGSRVRGCSEGGPRGKAWVVDCGGGLVARVCSDRAGS